MLHRSMLLVLFGSASFLQTAHTSDLQFINPHAERGASDAVIVGDVSLVHTAQLTAFDRKGFTAKDVNSETEQVLENLQAALAAANSRLDKIVKLNVYLTADESRAEVDATLAKTFATNRKPAVSYVTTKLPVAGARVAMDAIAVSGNEGQQVQQLPVEQLGPANAARAAVIPPGARIYVAGQAEKGADLSEATRLTLASLRKTLEFLGRSDADVVQLKAFLSPMDDVQTVTAAIASFYRKQERLPTLVFVEWTSPLIEIELIAWGGDKHEGPAIEFITPPGMSASPVYSRVARINRTSSIYTTGFFAITSGDAAAETNDIFQQLEQVLSKAGSDFKHLAKATYYCSTNATSQKLNELRPNYYDPQRPPSASKAMVRGVGQANRALTLDMIAVPISKP